MNMPVFLALLLLVNTWPVKFRLLQIKLLWAVLCKSFCRHEPSFLLHKCPNGVAGSWGAYMFSFIRTVRLFLTLFHTPVIRVCEFQLLHPCQYLVLSINFSHSGECVVVWYYGLNLHFPDDQWYWSVYIGYLHIFFCDRVICLK